MVPNFVFAESSTSIIEHDEIVSLKTRVPIGRAILIPISIKDLACVIAALDERQQMSGESSIRSNNENTSSFNMPPGSRRFYNRIGRDMVSYSAAENLDEGAPDDAMETTSSHGQWSISHGFETTTSYANSVDAED
ncbi:hypothetical protein MTR_7g032100 [Medicago truncatula]|uniref:Uncharacterized protein n=1 Tax=Medicago truncatula TaxID=3880 RepID=Q2HU91_MEDTR|nr:hypothetical protein MtrDRAFT_AC149208g9v2 [Medicago truncatula]AES78473.2 hypothetical protein MTR_7g032100 [Medicago truncatula]